MLIVNATPGGGNIKNVEVLGIQNTTAAANFSIDVSKVSGINNVSVIDTHGQGLTINNAPTNVEFDYNATAFGAVTVNPAVANKDYTLTINNNPISGKTNGVDLTNGVTLNNANSITIDSIGGKLNSDFNDVVNGTKYNQISLTTSAKTVNLTGDTNLKFSTASTTVGTIDASKMTGGVQVTTTGTVVNRTVTTGSGNDLVNLADASDKYQTVKTGAGNDWIVTDDTVLTKKDTIDGGEGTDTLVIKDGGDADTKIDWTGNTFTNLDGVSNVEKLALNVTSQAGSTGAQELDLADTAVSKLGNNVTITWYTSDANGNAGADAIIDNSSVNSATAKITTDMSTLNNSKILKYTAGKNIDVVKGSKQGDIVNITDTNLGKDDSFDGGAGSDTLNLTLTGSGDNTEYSELKADKLANIKGFETLTLNVGTNNYAKVDISNDFAVANQNLTTNTLTIQPANLTKDYLTVDASGVKDVQLKVVGDNIGAKHVNITTGSANDKFVLNENTNGQTKTVSNATVDLGDGVNTLEFDTTDDTAATPNHTVNFDLSGSKFTNVNVIKFDKVGSTDNNNVNMNATVDASMISGKDIKLVNDATNANTKLIINGASTGSNANDTIDLTKLASGSNVDKIVVNGNGGDDTIKLSSTLTIATIVNGGDGDDDIIGGISDDKIKGDSGNDTIASGTGDDIVEGGAGVDNIDTGSGNDKIVVIGSGGSYSSGPAAGTGAAALGLTQNDLNNGNDDASGETYNGGSGNDTLEIWGNVDLTNDTVSNIETIDTHSNMSVNTAQLINLANNAPGGIVDVNLLDNNSTITLLDITQITPTQLTTLMNTLNKTDFDFHGNASALIKTNAVGFDVNMDNSTDSNDYFSMTSGELGTTGNDTIDASSQTSPKLLWGGAGDDTLIGGTKVDILAGGSGNDTFEFGSASAGTKIMPDFNHNDDTIKLSASAFGYDKDGGNDLDITSVTEGSTDIDAETAELVYINQDNNNDGNDDLTAAKMFDTSKVAAAIEDSVGIISDGDKATAKSVLFVIEASDQAGTFGIYNWTQSSDDDTNVGADELHIVGVAYGDSVAIDDFAYLA